MMCNSLQHFNNHYCPLNKSFCFFLHSCLMINLVLQHIRNALSCKCRPGDSKHSCWVVHIIYCVSYYPTPITPADVQPHALTCPVCPILQVQTWRHGMLSLGDWHNLLCTLLSSLIPLLSLLLILVLQHVQCTPYCMHRSGGTGACLWETVVSDL